MSDEVEVNVTKNGPYTIKGPATLKGADGEVWADIPEGANLALCRCGKSAKKPFCDGTHNKADFESEVTPESQPYPW